MRIAVVLLGTFLASPAWGNPYEFGIPLPERTLERIMRAERVWVYRVLDPNKSQGKRRLQGSPTVQGGEAIDSVKVPVEWARRWVLILASPSAWNAALRKGEPEQVAVVRFLTSKETTDVVLCFQDDAIAVYSTGQPRYVGRPEKERRAIIRWLQEAFPGESRIGSLRERFQGYDYEPPRPVRTPLPRGWERTDSPDESCLVLRVLVDRNGFPKSAERAVGPSDRESAALDAVKKWTFRPAFEGKKPVEEWVAFALKWPSN
jgi:hypothetical protein